MSDVPCPPLELLRRYRPHQPILLVIRTRREVERRRSRGRTEGESPQTVDRDVRAGGIVQIRHEVACPVVDADLAVAEVADQEPAALAAESFRGPGDRPW